MLTFVRERRITAPPGKNPKEAPPRKRYALVPPTKKYIPVGNGKKMRRTFGQGQEKYGLWEEWGRKMKQVNMCHVALIKPLDFICSKCGLSSFNKSATFSSIFTFCILQPALYSYKTLTQLQYPCFEDRTIIADFWRNTCCQLKISKFWTDLTCWHFYIHSYIFPKSHMISPCDPHPVHPGIPQWI